MQFSIHTFLPILLACIYVVALLLGGTWSKKISFAISDNSYISYQFNYQIILLSVTIISLFTTYLLNKSNFVNYFSFGQIGAQGEALPIFGIKKGDTWIKTGISLCIFISLVTVLILYFQWKKSSHELSELSTGIFWILLFSFSNSFGEEMIFRMGIVSPMSGLLTPIYIFIISGILFGIPHFAGMPNGFTGVALAGVLGFILAKSMFETQGFFWAWLIHFLQDVLIIGTLYLTNIKK